MVYKRCAFSCLWDDYKLIDLGLCSLIVSLTHHPSFTSFPFFYPTCCARLSPSTLADLHFLHCNYTLPKWLGKSLQSFFPGQRDSFLIPSHTWEIQSLIFSCPISMYQSHHKEIKHNRRN